MLAPITQEPGAQTLNNSNRTTTVGSIYAHFSSDCSRGRYPPKQKTVYLRFASAAVFTPLRSFQLCRIISDWPLSSLL